MLDHLLAFLEFKLVQQYLELGIPMILRSVFTEIDKPIPQLEISFQNQINNTKLYKTLQDLDKQNKTLLMRL